MVAFAQKKDGPTLVLEWETASLMTTNNCQQNLTAVLLTSRAFPLQQNVVKQSVQQNPPNPQSYFQIHFHHHFHY